jgi:hypothetical protein
MDLFGGAVPHAPEFQERERDSIQADPLLSKQDGAWRRGPDGDRQRQPHGRREHEKGAGQGDIQRPLAARPGCMRQQVRWEI